MRALLRTVRSGYNHATANRLQSRLSICNIHWWRSQLRACEPSAAEHFEDSFICEIKCIFSNRPPTRVNCPRRLLRPDMIVLLQRLWCAICKSTRTPTSARWQTSPRRRPMCFSVLWQSSAYMTINSYENFNGWHHVGTVTMQQLPDLMPTNRTLQVVTNAGA